MAYVAVFLDIPPTDVVLLNAAGDLPHEDYYGKPLQFNRPTCGKPGRSVGRDSKGTSDGKAKSISKI
jgi:hypothetical protein